jgi:hypothetical protein
MSMELADVTVSDVTVMNAAVGCTAQQVRVPFSLGGSGLPVLVPTLFWVGQDSLPCLAECPAGKFFMRFGFTGKQRAFRLHWQTACVLASPANSAPCRQSLVMPLHGTGLICAQMNVPAAHHWWIVLEKTMLHHQLQQLTW